MPQIIKEFPVKIAIPFSKNSDLFKIKIDFLLNWLMELIIFHRNKFHKIKTPSLAPVIICLSSGENLTVLIAPECPKPSASNCCV